MNPNPPSTKGMWHGARSLDPTTAARWIDALDAYRASQERRVSEGLVRTRVKHLRRFALFAGVSPWHVSERQVGEWLLSIEGLASSTQTSMRSALRSFYRWGLEAGRATADPTETVTHQSLKLPVPPQWEEPIIAFERHLWSRGMQPETVRAWGEQLRTFARDHASRGPFELTVDDLFEWMAGKRWARETRRNRKSLLRTFYGWAVDTERITVEDDPTQRLPKIKGADPVARPATDDEYAGALAAADERWTLALRLAAELGMRRAEVARVHSSDIRQDARGQWTLTVHGKGAKIRVLPLPESLSVALRSQPVGYLFPGRIVEKQAHVAREGHLSARYMGKQIAELLPPGVTMHTLRHRFATRAYNVDRDVLTVQRLLGHASPATTQRYVRVSDEKMRALVESVSGR
ncbi:tyrosine-type recombinase/integrase [Microbacterium sp. AZCO]|uniref:tyrosine-type recombinase/integrase n=1 Tax=Microbacterium sp. AZCO TaxID=3142976 RepID=UPI0031F3A3FA